MAPQNQHEKEMPTEFSLSNREIQIIQSFAVLLRARLAKEDPHFIHTAAAAILAIERLPKVTPAVQATIGYRTTGAARNYGWAELLLSEEEIRASTGERFYDPEVGGDTESETRFLLGLGHESRCGDLEEWHAHATAFATEGYLFLRDESELDEVNWWPDE